MIKNSFIFLEKIGKGKEEKLWKSGIRDWSEFLKQKDIKGIDRQKKEYYNRKIKEAQKALLDEDAGYFVNKLPKKEMWRLYNCFREECCYLDIEVDSYGEIILVGISDYYNTKIFLKGINLEKEFLEKELNNYKLLVTFNGSSFDLPKLRKKGIKIKMAHIDLKPLCVNLGLKGGLKEVEKILRLKRPKHLNGNPVDLWKAFHASGDREYLELLVDYNKEDIENLKGVMDFVYKEMKSKLNNNSL